MLFFSRRKGLFVVPFLFGFGVALANASEAILLRCSAFGGSHTIRMSFLFEEAECRLYWREISQVLEMEVCAPPHLVARKPYGDGRESLVHFHLGSGAFMDQWGGVEEAGRCVVGGEGEG